MPPRLRPNLLLRPDRVAATATAAPAAAAPPASSAVFAFFAALATPSAAFWAPELTLSLTASRPLLVVLRPFREAVDRERLLCLARWFERFWAEFRELLAVLRDRLPELALDAFRLVDAFRWLDAFRPLLAFVWAILTPPSSASFHSSSASRTRDLQH